MNASRKLDILKLFNGSESLTVKELSEKLNCSESSVRRDLIDLDSQGLLKKVHGGAIKQFAESGVEDKEIAERMSVNVVSKMKIGALASGLVSDGDTVYLDAGTTVSFIIDEIKAKNAVFVTNSHHHAEKLSSMGFTVYGIGGEYKSKTAAYVGSMAAKMLESYHFNIGFFGTNGISESAGFSTPDEKEATVKRAAMLRCDKTYVVADSSKFNKSAFVSFAKLEDAVLITDDEGSEFALAGLRIFN